MKRRSRTESRPINIRVPLDILEHFRHDEPGYQTRIVDALREHMLADGFRGIVQGILERELDKKGAGDE